MLSNYFMLLNVSRSIHGQCVGRTISEVYSQQKQQLCIVVETRTVSTIVVSCEPSRNYVYIRDGNFRARKNSVDLFPDICGKKIRGAACDPADRVVEISVDENLRLECEMFGARANILLWKREETVPVSSEVLIDAFLKKSGLHGTRRTAKERTGSPGYAGMTATAAEFSAAMRSKETDGILQALKKTVPNLGSTLAREILFRANLDPSAPASAASDNDLGKIYAEASGIIRQLTSPDGTAQARIYSDDQTPIAISLLPLRMYNDAAVEPFEDASAAIRRYIGMSRSSSDFSAEKQKLSAWLEKEEAKAVHTRSKIAADLAEADRSAAYELHGKLIMSNIHTLRKGMKSASLENPFSSGLSDGVISVALDPSLTPAANAERYFAKAKKSKIAAQESGERVRSLDQRVEAIRALSAEVSEISSELMLKEFVATNREALKRLGFLTEKEKEDLPPFRLFTVEGGFQVLAGKSSENNDMLTMKFAKPNDLWFHCRGSSGSHVVLKINSAPGEPSKSAIHQAASIAAYYSKMKNASSVPVVMTEKKYVRKPKGAPAGTVTLDREKVLFVEPKLPPSHS